MYCISQVFVKRIYPCHISPLMPGTQYLSPSPRPGRFAAPRCPDTRRIPHAWYLLVKSAVLRGVDAVLCRSRSTSFI